LVVTDSQFLLDSNICIYVLADADGPSAQRIGQAALGSVVTSVIVYAEVMRGIGGEHSEAIHSAHRFFEIVPPLPFDQTAAGRYAQLPIRRANYDRLIAAHALSLELTLVTNNVSDFADIPGLRVENWAR
jgi:tRNA(fMet)-specific endonuclease VapC